jgi:periplasmic protein TonB
MIRPFALLLIGLGIASTALAQDSGASLADKVAIDDALQLYGARLLQVSAKVRSYPEAAVAQQIEGTVQVNVTVGADGKLKQRELIRSSGHALLDEHALAMVETAVPLTEIPLALKNRQFLAMVTFVFSLAGQNRA